MPVPFSLPYYNYDATGNRTSEQVDANVTQATPNNVNQVSTFTAGGPTRFQGIISQPGTVSVNGQSASQATSTNFVANPVLIGGTNTVVVVATNGNNVAQTNNYQVVIPATGTITPTYDADGNLTSNGNGQTYAWDAENRLVITYTGGATSNFTYDALGERAKIVESSGSTKQLIWADGQMVEQRDSTGTNVTARFYPEGEQISGTKYYYTFDHLGSIRELTTSTGAIAAQYDYDPYGRVTLVQGTNLSDFQYAGYYEHAPSSLNLTLFRAYDSNTARWLSRDPLGEDGGINLYGYALNSPVNAIDPLGLVAVINYTNGTSTIASNASQFTNAVNSPAAANGGISNITIDGHASVGSQSLGFGKNDSEIGIGGPGDPYGVFLRSDPNDTSKGVSLSDLLKGKLAKNASIDLQGCSTAGPSPGKGQTNIAQALSNQLGVTTSGSPGPVTGHYLPGGTLPLWNDYPSGIQSYPKH